MGKRVKDTYGRYVGFVVGTSTDPFGEPRAIAVDSGQGGFTEIPSQYVRQDGDFLVMTPTWRLDAEKFGKENGLVQSRAQAIEDLLKEGEISQDEYAETLKVYDGYKAKLAEVRKHLEERLKKRDQELDKENREIKRLSTNIKVQFRSGEIDAESFRSSLQYASLMRERIEREKNDVAITFNSLTSPSEPQVVQTTPQQQEEGQTEVEEAGTEYTPQAQRPLAEAGWLARFLKGRA